MDKISNQSFEHLNREVVNSNGYVTFPSSFWKFMCCAGIHTLGRMLKKDSLGLEMKIWKNFENEERMWKQILKKT